MRVCMCVACAHMWVRVCVGCFVIPSVDHVPEATPPAPCLLPLSAPSGPPPASFRSQLCQARPWGPGAVGQGRCSLMMTHCLHITVLARNREGGALCVWGGKPLH